MDLSTLKYLPDEDIVPLLIEALMRDFPLGRDLYTKRLYASRHKEDALMMVKIYFNEIHASLAENLPVMSDLAAIFVAENSSVGEYRRVCKMIEDLLVKRQGQ